ncbi:hypothetical protein M9979_12715 [Sphingomonas sp. RP10(2022)]|uniref:Uncharacterized protein n=1 Tax=Sphingomonas liriopis TaxID=2949094 RepID=A0A9X2HQQ0_9SPHN|nr:hypothetical protein [Sphingomonas liriopis]MCP3735736.1 hypothetical protein [Sphingomonas liriopis]
MAEAERAAARLSDIEAAVVALGDEDLLDLADIFANAPGTPLAGMAATEMRRRKLSL